MPDTLAQTVQIVSSHVANNNVPSDKLTDLIRNVHQTLIGLGGNGSEMDALPPATTSQQTMPATARQSLPAVRRDGPKPAVPIEDSVFPEYIVCLEDGLPMKMLKRHLQTAFNMTPDQYRARWGLPPNYPMVAPKYAETRSMLAKRSGLGHSRYRQMVGVTSPAVEQQDEDEVIQAPPRAKGTVQRVPEGVSGHKKTNRRRAA